MNAAITTTYIDHADAINVESLTERRDEIDAEIEQAEQYGEPVADLIAERTLLTAVLAELCGEGGDHQWNGDWYPSYLIADYYFTNYARELLEDIGEIPANLPHYIEIDWETTARNIRGDYTSIEIEGNTYWFR